MTLPRRLLIIADVGGAETRHIGDEAMLEANLAAFRGLIPDVAFTLVSRDPAWTTARYGVNAVAPFGFTRDPSAGAERASMLDRLVSYTKDNGAKDRTIEAIAEADGLVVSGGGNLSSTWPDLLYERVALLRLALIFEKPAVVLGQTIGPALEGYESQLLTKALCPARFVGLRELPSLALAMELGIPREVLWYQSDDALFPEGDLGALLTSVPVLERSSKSSIAVTIDPQIRAAGEALFGAVVSQLRELSAAMDASLVLIPHAFGGESTADPSDRTEAIILAERLGLSGTIVAADLEVSQVRQATGNAALVISSRYHPIVFGLAARVPCLGIYGDDYCRIKLQGALAHAGLEEWAITYDDVIRGGLLTKALALWRVREGVRGEIESRSDAWHEEYRQRWAAVIRALDPEKTPLPVVNSTVFGRVPQDMPPALVAALDTRRQWRHYEKDSMQKSAERGDDFRRSTHIGAKEIEERSVLGRYASAMLSKLRRLRP